MALLEVRNVSKYFGGLAAISELDLNINEGEIRGLIGPNGSGKTTLFNVISGIYKPTRGEIIYKGGNITSLSPDAVAKRGIVRTFQLTNLFMDFTVAESVSVAHHLHSGVGFFGALLNSPSTRQKERDIRIKSMEILELLEIAHLKDELAENLPHGHQRALSIAIALAAQPELLMLDEPVSGMNPEETMHLMGIIQKIRERGITILLVEHDMRAVMGTCDNVTVINFGKKIAEGLPEEIRKNEEVIKSYLGAEEIVT